jgi:hypothetical protein
MRIADLGGAKSWKWLDTDRLTKIGLWRAVVAAGEFGDRRGIA